MISRNTKILCWIIQHYLKNPPMRQMREDLRFGHDVTKAMSDFHAEHGVTPEVFMKRRRMAFAAQHLSSPRMTMTLQELSQALSCRNEVAFSSEFESVYGMSPKAYRAKILQKLGLVA